jgi:dihydroorotate dehydrogenase
LRGLQDKDALQELLAQIGAARSAARASHGDKPVFVKVAPDLDELAIDDITALAIDHAIDGLIVSNTTLARPESLKSIHRGEQGGLSGAPLFQRATLILKQFAAAAAGRLTLIGAGGVRDGAGALAKIKAGATAVQLYSALALEGPGLIGQILDDLSARLRAEGFASVKDAIGADLS